MEKEEILQRTKESIFALFEEIKSNPENYKLECDVHFDLYFLLNHKNEIFWKNKSVEVEYRIKEKSEERMDIVIYDLDQDEPHEVIAIEIKCNSIDEYKGQNLNGGRYRDIEWDFYKLSKMKKEYTDIEPIFIYVKNNEKSVSDNYKKIIENIKGYKEKYTDALV